jgi:hypothetical protein
MENQMQTKKYLFRIEGTTNVSWGPELRSATVFLTKEEADAAIKAKGKDATGIEKIDAYVVVKDENITL